MITLSYSGESISSFDGLIKHNFTTNSYDLNPNEIIFGSNTSLNIGGSRIASTASELEFVDDDQFSVTNVEVESYELPNDPNDVFSLEFVDDDQFSVTANEESYELPNDPNDVFSTVESEAVSNVGRGGLLTINSSNTITFGSINAGDISAWLFTPTDGATLTSRTFSSQEGAGKISIHAESLTLTGGATLTSSPEQGTTGNIEIVSSLIELDNGTYTEVTTFGGGGNITLQIQDLLLLRRNRPTNTTEDTTQAGSIGGNITINAPNGFIVAVPTEDSDIADSSELDLDGIVEIPPDIDPNIIYFPE